MICPFLKDELCSIYNDRPSCCRNMPNSTPGMFCYDHLKCVYDSDGNVDCKNCADKCCKHLQIPDNTSKLDVLRHLTMTCDECKVKYDSAPKYKDKKIHYINVVS